MAKQLGGELVDAWNRLMLGIDVDTNGFVQALLQGLTRAERIAATVHAGHEIEITTKAGSTTFPAEAANAKFRMLCARLAVVFGGDTRDPPVLYGGRLAAQLRVGDEVISAELEFENTAAGAWFRLERRF